MFRAIGLFAGAVSLAIGLSSVSAQKRVLIPVKDLPVLVQKIEVKNTVRMTAFDPKRHGFNFSNTFRNNFVSEFDIRTGGLCGGMVYSALDYWKAGKPIPQQTYLPTEGSVLQSYIYNRQVLSLARNLDRWGELTINPGGARNNEYWRWGMEGKRGGQLDVLKRNIDAGRPVPLGLLSCDEDCNGHHQVLAIGYDVGRYKGDLGQYQADLKIIVYDPNRPNTSRILRSNSTTRKFYFEDNADDNWRTYFVDTKWNAGNPPTVSALERELLLTFETGEDDLRSRLSIALERNNGGDINLFNVTDSKRWITNSTQTVGISLPSGVTYNNLTGIRLRRWSSDLNDLQRAGTDNWDLRRLLIRSGDADGKNTLFNRAGSPLHRFTADAPNVVYKFGAAASELVVTFYTGRDDLRGGNDNADLFIVLKSGRSIPFRNVNEGRKWENGATITRYLDLPAGITHRDIAGARIVTTSRGGSGGDNWNLFALNVKTHEGGAEHQLFYREGDDDGPLHRFTGERSGRAKTWTF